MRQYKAKKIILYLILLSFLLINIFYLFNERSISWDSAVYIGMGKYIFSKGEAGIWEPLRPIVLPILIGILWKLGIESILAYNIILLLCSCVCVFLTWEIAKTLFDKNTAIISTILLVLTPLFLLNSSKILTGIISTMFSLFSVYFFIKNRTKNSLAFAGIFAALAFLTRFAQGLLVVCYFTYYLVDVIKQRKLHNLGDIKRMKGFLGVVLWFMIITIPYFILNYILYIKITNNVIKAAFFPLILYEHVAIYYNWVYSQSYWHYILFLIKDNYLFIFSLLGMLLLIKKSLKTKSPNKGLILVSIVIIYFMFLEIIDHKEARYLIVILPYISILSALGLKYFLSVLVPKKVLSGLVLAVSILVLMTNSSFSYIDSLNEQDYSEEEIEHFSYFKDKKIQGAILTTNPLAVIYSDNLYVPFYYTLDYTIEQWNSNPDYSYIIYSEYAFPCMEDDEECKEKKRYLKDALLQTNKVVRNTTYINKEHYILSRH